MGIGFVGGGVAFAEGIDRRAITADQLTLAKGY